MDLETSDKEFYFRRPYLVVPALFSLPFNLFGGKQMCSVKWHINFVLEES